MYLRDHVDKSTLSYGVYYSHSAAHAGTSTSSTIVGSDLPYDICAKNWHIPTLTIFSNLISSYGNNNKMQTDFNPVSGGGYWNGSGDYSNTYGAVYQTSTVNDYYSNQCAWTFQSSTWSMDRTYSRGDGIPRRCLVK